LDAVALHPACSTTAREHQEREIVFTLPLSELNQVATYTGIHRGVAEKTRRTLRTLPLGGPRQALNVCNIPKVYFGRFEGLAETFGTIFC